jgi:3-hydroxybutyryl-CoA dehydratase
VIGKTIAELATGDQAQLTRVVESGGIRSFVDAVGDHNPLHGDAAYAAGTPFKTPIAPGIYTAGLISAVIGTQLPGPGAIYLSQSLKFVKPVRSGDRITARVQVAEVIRERNRIRLETVCVNQREEAVLAGEAWVMPPPARVVYESRATATAALAGLAWSPWAWAAQAVTLWSLASLSVLASGFDLAAAGATTSATRR